jgi:hypothetical protein
MDIKEIPPLIPPHDIKPKFGGPGVTTIYMLLAEKKLRGVKIGRNTRIVGKSYVEYMGSLPDYEPEGPGL